MFLSFILYLLLINAFFKKLILLTNNKIHVKKKMKMKNIFMTKQAGYVDLLSGAWYI